MVIMGWPPVWCVQCIIPPNPPILGGASPPSPPILGGVPRQTRPTPLRALTTSTIAWCDVPASPRQAPPRIGGPGGTPRDPQHPTPITSHPPRDRRRRRRHLH